MGFGPYRVDGRDWTLINVKLPGPLPVFADGAIALDYAGLPCFSPENDDLPAHERAGEQMAWQELV